MKSVTGVRSSLKKLTDPNGQSISTSLQIEGNLLVEDGKLFEALKLYNKSLCVAQSNSPDISSAYECRSVAYLKANEYQLCVDNIELARKYCDNIDRIEVLSNRKKKCEKLIEFDQRKIDDGSSNFFKLSHQPNDKTPFVVDCLELHNNKKFGRFIITNEDLKAGDIIAIEEPFFKTVNYEAAHTRCTNCLKSNKLNLIPSETSQTGKIIVSKFIRP